jgi:mRNA interferase MazF
VPHPQDPPKRGEIYWVDFDPARGSEQAGHRPAVVISTDSFNKLMRVVTVAAITSQIKTAAKYTAVILPAGRPLPKESQILAFQVMSLDKSRLTSYAGTLTGGQIVAMESALRISWGL